MRVHLVTPTPHRPVGPGWEPDAYCGKAWRLCKMLTGVGHHVIFYGSFDDEVDAAEHVTVVTVEDRRRWWGDETWEETVFNEFDPLSAPWVATNSRAVVAMQHTVEPGDIVGLTMGSAQQPVQVAFPNHVVCEVGVGYEGVLQTTHRCFESEAWRHFIYGRTGINDGRWFDTVIPNAFDPGELVFSAEKDDYLLFMGRLTPRKGLEVVSQLAERHRVVTAGQGEPLHGVEHRGMVRGKEKAELLAGARAVLCPTQYIEPFGGVAVEAMLSGTPVITSPFGAFTETVADGISGFRCHTLAQFTQAVDAVADLDPKAVFEWAHDRFTLGPVARQYDRWFGRLATLYGRGWYECT